MYRLMAPVLAAIAFIALLTAQTALGEQVAGTPSPLVEPRALDLLRSVGTTLGGAKSFTFRTRNVPGGNGPSVDFFSDSQFAVMRPNKLRASVRGDAPPLDFYFDGTLLTVYQPTLNLYASTAEPGTVEALIPFALQRAGILFPLADLAGGDPYATMIRSITRARYTGVATIAGIRCDHAAFAGPGAEWEIWIDARRSLPCRLTGTLRDTQGASNFAMDFFDWKLNPPLSAASFAFAKPAGASQIDFRALTGLGNL
jgi:hypothetical protein